MKSSEVLEKAHDFLDNNGWMQFASHSNGSYCAIGAIVKGTGVLKDGLEPIGVVFSYLYKVTGVHGIIEWNDAPGRTKEEVLDALMAAAKLARNEGD